MKIDLYKKEIRSLMTCLASSKCVTFSRQQRIILNKINPDKLYNKLSNYFIYDKDGKSMGVEQKKAFERVFCKGK